MLWPSSRMHHCDDRGLGYSSSPFLAAFRAFELAIGRGREGERVGGREREHHFSFFSYVSVCVTVLFLMCIFL